MHIHVCLFWQLIGEKVAHAYTCVSVLDALPAAQPTASKHEGNSRETVEPS